MTRTLKTILFGACMSSLVALTGAANATVFIVNPSGAPVFPGDSNVIFNGCGGGEVLGPAATVTGCLEDNHSALFDFTGDEDLEILGGGQARVDDNGEDGFQFMEVTAQSGGFASFITNIMVTDHINGTPQTGVVEITPFIGGVAQAAMQFNIFEVDESGSNWFGIYTDNADVFSSIEFQILDFGETGVEFDDFRQNRIGLAIDGGPGPGPGEIPSPAALGLLGLGMAALSLLARRRKRT